MTHTDIIKTLERAKDAPDNPFDLFKIWMEDAVEHEPNDPNAMCLATIDPDGRPSARIVLLKTLDENGFVFFTNRESRKGLALAAHPQAALNFHWKSLTRTVRIEGIATPIDDEESDAYYQSRPKGSRIGAWASQQSRMLESRALLAGRVAALEKEYEDNDDIPRPPYWGGYRVVPDRIEFWHDGLHRLHTRLLYSRNNAGSWDRQMLYP